MVGCHTIICWESAGPLDALETFDSSFSISSCIQTSEGQLLVNHVLISASYNTTA